MCEHVRAAGDRGYLLVAALTTGKQVYAAGAALAGLLGLVSLAYTCVSVVYCLHPRERSVWRRQHARDRAADCER